MPSAWLSQYSLRNGGSVPSCWVTSYCIGLSFFFSSASLGFLKFMDHPFGLVAAAWAGLVAAGAAIWAWVFAVGAVAAWPPAASPHSSFRRASRPQPRRYE